MCVCVCLLRVSLVSLDLKILMAHVMYAHSTHRHPGTQNPPHMSLSLLQQYVCVAANNRTDLNLSTCDFLQTGLVAVSSLNSAEIPTISGMLADPQAVNLTLCFSTPECTTALSKRTALCWMWSTTISNARVHLKWLCCPVDRKAELNVYETREHTAVNNQQFFSCNTDKHLMHGQTHKI